MKKSLEASKLIYMATSTKDGVPNVAPMGAFKLMDDETILISDQFMNKTAGNLKENPWISIAFWGEAGGFQIKGKGTIHTDDQVFKDDVEWMKQLRPNLKPKGAIVMKITDVFIIKAGPDAGKKLL